MTSNIGSRQLKDFGQGVGFATSSRSSQADEHARGVIENSLKKAFAPEFLNRVDDVIVFNSLSKEDIFKIIDIELDSLYKRVIELGYKVRLTDEAKEFLTEKGYDANFGARPLKRAIQKYIEDPMAEEIIKGELAEGDTIELQRDPDQELLKVAIIKPPKTRKKKEES